MNNSKIDCFLLSKTKTLSQDKKITCIVKAYNFDRVKKFLQEKNIEIIDEYLFIKSFFIKISKEELAKISALVSVEYIFSVSTASMMTYLSRKILHTDKTYLTGKGVTTALIDTGVVPHLDFYLGKKRLKRFKDFVNNKKTPYDDNGHGTFVCGVMAGSGAESVGKYSGIAPGCDIVALKALDKNGEAYSNKILDAMEWIYDNHKKENIRVVCMSFGSEPLGYKDPIMSGADALWNDGVIVVCAAGNSGPEFQTIKSPGISQKIITVGGIDDNRLSENEYDKKLFEIAEFSSRGPAFQKFKPDVVAPSVDITSCDKNGSYTVLSGTSVATPMIAGMLCLLCEKYPDLKPEQAKKILGHISEPITFNRNLEGFGLPNLEKIILN